MKVKTPVGGKKLVGKGTVPPSLSVNIQSLLPPIIIKSPHSLPGRTIQRTFKIPHQTRSSRLCLLLNRILLIYCHSPLSDPKLLVYTLGSAEDIIQNAVETFRDAMGVINVDCFLEGLVCQSVAVG